MFTNLIESSADKAAFKRRSSFFLATVASYALFLFAAGIVGVLTYDAQVEAQTTNLLVELAIPPVDRAPEEPERPRDSSPVQRPRQANAPVDRNVRVPERTEGITAINDPTRVPEDIGTTASKVPPVTGNYRISNRNVNAPAVTPPTSGCVSCDVGPPTVVETVTPPLPPTPPKRTVIVSEGVIRGKVLEMPKPIYPILAKQARIQGPVNIQILIDETGKVVSAQAVKGSPMLTPAAVEAARRARFTPTKLGDQPVKVQGVITYNFVLQQ